MSLINPNNINGGFPVFGQDNPTQGFRDNFTNIKNNLNFAKQEIEDLQNKAVLKTALSGSALDNDMQGAVLTNPQLKSFTVSYYDIGTQSGSVTVDFEVGNFQKITMSGATILNFSFPVNISNQYASIKLWVSNPSAAYTLTFPNSLTLGDPDTVAGFSGNTITFSSADISNSTDYYFEIFTVDGGTTLGIQDLTRNRDFDGNSISISGDLTGISNFSATGNVLLGSSTTSNVVITATTRANNATTGALVVLGGAAISGNTFVNGNLMINGGIINPDYLLANVVTGQNLFANVDYNRFIANCSPTGTVANLFITLPNSVEDGRTIDITSMTAITSCFVSNMTPDVTSVYGLANNWAASASLTSSISIKLLYNSSVERWFKV